MRDVFISHTQRDQSFIDQVLLPAFQSQGITFWYSKEDIKTSEEWERRIVDGLEDCAWFLVVLTEKAAASRWLKAEVQWAMDNRQGKIVPVLLRSCKISDIYLPLIRIQYTDFRRDQQAGLRSLLEIWGKTSQPAPVVPKHPRPWRMIFITAIVLCSLTVIAIYTRNKKAPADVPAASTDSAGFYYRLGIAEYNQGEFQQSVAAFTKAIAAGYPDNEIYVDRGDALRRAGQTPDACEDYKIARDSGKADGLDRYQEYCPLDSISRQRAKAH